MIDTFLFDMGNVLVHFSHDRMCEQIARVCGGTPAAVRHVLFELHWERELECGQLTDPQFQARMQDYFKQDIDLPALLHAASDIFTLNAPMVPILKSLKRQGKRLVLLSNTSFAHIRHVQRAFDVLSHFDDLVLSCEVGAMKADPAIYQAALGKIQCPPERCYYADDIAAYVEAGRRYGLQSEIFTTAESLCGHLADRGITVD